VLYVILFLPSLTVAFCINKVSTISAGDVHGHVLILPDNWTFRYSDLGWNKVISTPGLTYESNIDLINSDERLWERWGGLKGWVWTEPYTEIYGYITPINFGSATIECGTAAFHFAEQLSTLLSLVGAPPSSCGNSELVYWTPIMVYVVEPGCYGGGKYQYVTGSGGFYAVYSRQPGGGGGGSGGGGGDSPSCDNITISVASTEVWPVIPESQRPIGYSEDRSTTTVVISSNKITPPEGCTVSFSVEPVKNSGGHIEDNNAHTGTRQRGTITSITLPGSSQGTASVTYKSSEVSGVERITAELVGSSQIGAFNVNIKVPWLEPLSGEYFSLKCDIEPANCSDYKHTDFYNVQSWVNSIFYRIAYEYQEKFPNDGTLVVTDASLAWGGLYDYMNTWDTPHTYHRIGTDIDVRSKNIPEDNRDEFEKIVCENYGFPKLESPGKPNEHYHLYFLPYDADKVDLCIEDAPGGGDSGGGDIPT